MAVRYRNHVRKSSTAPGAGAALVAALVAAAPVSAARSAGDWPLNGRTFHEEHYSPLRQVNPGNARTLGLAFEFDDFVVRGRTHRDNEATPLMVDGTLYFSGPWSVVIDGTDYLAVLAGFGGAMNGIGYPPGAAAWTYQNTERLLVFKLHGRAVPKPPLVTRMEFEPRETAAGDAADVARGEQLFLSRCADCHALRGVRNGYPDLWNLPASVHAMFETIVHDGALAYAGMPSFADALSTADVRAIHAFLSADQRRLHARTPP